MLRAALEDSVLDDAPRVRTTDGWRHPMPATLGFRHQYDEQVARGGWEFYELRPGLWLLPVNMEAHEEILRHHCFGDLLVLSAVLRGGIIMNAPKGSPGELANGYCTMYSIQEGVNTIYETGNSLRWATIIVDRRCLASATGLENEDLPDSVRQLIACGGTLPFRNVPLPGAASLAVSQILDCRLTGSFRRTFLHAKTLELLCLLLLAFDDNAADKTDEAILSEPYIRKIHEARRMIEQSLDAPPTIPELAAAVGTTRQRLQLGFRQLYGSTVAETRNRLRIEHALDLVRRSHTPMTHIALEAGYEYLASFTRAFKAAYGVSPSQMRRMTRNEAPAISPKPI